MPSAAQEVPRDPAAGSASAGTASPESTSSASTAWTWRTGASVFFGVNHQRRAFRDFTAWESQNWWMAMAERRTPAASINVSAMLSLEPYTIKDIGSPQVFQTGETFRGAPLIDYQHPHDLIMQLGATVSRRLGSVTLLGSAFVIGAPALGPTVFMHRASAAGNPQAPLSHHYLDSSHITPGVVTAGVERGPWRFEGSWFQGLEPDENRLDLDIASPDSWSTRLSWMRGPWQAQVSAARLTRPERVTPYDADKLTASVAFASKSGARSFDWFAGFGQKREVHGNLEAYMLEAVAHLTRRHGIYTRLESVAKDVLDSGFHPGVFHRHRQSQVGAFTAGYLHTLREIPAGTLSAGADVTGYRVPANLSESYGSPASFHVFLRFATRDTDHTAHAH
jgi:hypothetical protein